MLSASHTDAYTLGPWATAFLSFSCPFVFFGGLGAYLFESSSDMERLTMVSETVALRNPKLESEYEQAFLKPGLLGGVAGLTIWALLVSSKRRKERHSEAMIHVSSSSNN
jgi:hypothetical protein